MPIVGIDSAANRFGRPAFLASDATRQADLAFLRQSAKTSIFTGKATREARASSFIRMHTAIRQTLAILARDPILVDTGQFQPKYQLRSYADQEYGLELLVEPVTQLHRQGEIALRRAHDQNPPCARTRLEREVEERIQAIKQRMLLQGYTKSAAEVEEEVRKRHEALRARPDDDNPPPLHSNERRRPRR